jgi:hypothetical protein
MILVSPIPTPADGAVYSSFIWRVNSAVWDRRHTFNVWPLVLIQPRTHSIGGRSRANFTGPWRHLIFLSDTCYKKVSNLRAAAPTKAICTPRRPRQV